MGVRKVRGWEGGLRVWGNGGVGSGGSGRKEKCGN